MANQQEEQQQQSCKAYNPSQNVREESSQSQTNASINLIPMSLRSSQRQSHSCVREPSRQRSEGKREQRSNLSNPSRHREFPLKRRPLPAIKAKNPDSVHPLQKLKDNPLNIVPGSGPISGAEHQRREADAQLVYQGSVPIAGGKQPQISSRRSKIQARDENQQEQEVQSNRVSEDSSSDGEWVDSAGIPIRNNQRKDVKGKGKAPKDVKDVVEESIGARYSSLNASNQWSRSTDGYNRRNPNQKREPFEKLRPRVLALCHSLWKGRPDSDFTIKRMSGGSFNRIVLVIVKPKVILPKTRYEKIAEVRHRFLDGLYLMTKKLAPGEYERAVAADDPFARLWTDGEFILRIPKRQNKGVKGFDFEADARNHDLVADLGIDCPKIVTYSASTTNPLGQPYLLMERAKGKPLDSFFGELTTKQQCQIAEQIGKICKKMVACQAPILGTLLSLEPIRKIEDGTLRRRKTYQENPWLRLAMADGSWNRTPLELIKGAYDVGRRCPRINKRGQDLGEVPWQALAMIAQELDKEAAFGPKGWYFSHNDFFPRNIVGKIDDDGNATVTSIIDWDMCSWQPAVRAHKAPSWLWQFSLYNGHLPDEDYFDIGAGEKPLHQKEAKVKAAFDHAVGEEYCKIAYHECAFIARKMCFWATEHTEVGLKAWPLWCRWYCSHWRNFEKILMQKWRENAAMIYDGNDEVGPEDIIIPMYW